MKASKTKLLGLVALSIIINATSLWAQSPPKSSELTPNTTLVSTDDVGTDVLSMHKNRKKILFDLANNPNEIEKILEKLLLRDKERALKELEEEIKNIKTI